MFRIQKLLLRPPKIWIRLARNTCISSNNRAKSGLPGHSVCFALLWSKRSRRCSLANDRTDFYIPFNMPSKVADLETSITSPASLAPLESDFARQQHQKQLKNNYHSSSLAKMVPQNVNRTSLHPGGVE